jgi:MFS transporter, MHS family, proline/betaine transporter
MTGEYGADVTRAQFIRLVIAICTGTLIEWFDFTIYTGLSATISAVFFDAKSGHVGYWAIWAVGFVSRPAGAVLFGHLGDTRGRRFTLLLSILCVSVPTILIGALPTYAQAGAAAPVLLGIMRAIQGLAVGGEVCLMSRHLFIGRALACMCGQHALLDD